ncbi:TPA: hypothetical protein ACGY23_001533, partial [Listeria monocytogenes]
MKEMIYMDSEFINSFISQVYDGLPVNLESGSKESNGEHATDQSGEKSTTSTQGSLLFLKGKYNYSTDENNQHSVMQTQETQEIISKKMHDNALNDFEEYLVTEKKLKTTIEDAKNGEYVKLTIPFRFIDYKFLRSLYSKKILDSMLIFTNHDTNESLEFLENEAKNASKDQKNEIKHQIKHLRKELEETNKGAEHGFNLMNAMFDVVVDALPTNYYLKEENILIPLKEKYFREDIRMLSFKYNFDNQANLITIIGKVTGKFERLIDEKYFRD